MKMVILVGTVKPLQIQSIIPKAADFFPSSNLILHLTAHLDMFLIKNFG